MRFPSSLRWRPSDDGPASDEATAAACESMCLSKVARSASRGDVVMTQDRVGRKQSRPERSDRCDRIVLRRSKRQESLRNPLTAPSEIRERAEMVLLEINTHD